MSEAGGGVFQFVGRFEREWLYSIARTSGITVTQLSGEGLEERLDALQERVAAEGLRIFPQVRGRGTMILLNLEGSLHPWVLNLAYRELVGDLPLPEKLRRMRDPEVRARILASDWDLSKDARRNRAEDAGHPFLADATPGSLLPGLLELMLSEPEAVFILGDPPDYEPEESASVAAYARRRGVGNADAFYDLLTEGDGGTLLIYYLDGYARRNFDYMADLMRHPLTRNGLSDAGAHVGAVSDAHMPSWNLAFWGRDRSRGATVPLETIVYKQTRGNAEVYGLHDRGLLRPGLRADLNVIDYDRLASPAPYVVYDLPENARRFMQRPQGYCATVCAGQVVLEEDEVTGALPGRLVRRRRQ